MRVDLTATQRVALHRYSFALPGKVQVLVDLGHIIHFIPGPRATRADSRLSPDGLLTGSAHIKNWSERDVAFALRFDHPILNWRRLPTLPGDLSARYLLTFKIGSGRQLQARVALSTTDVGGAKRNLDADGDLRFDEARRRAGKAWESLLGRVSIDATPAQQRVFFTALYHAFLHPSDIADVDGRVRGPDGNIIDAPGGHYYSTLSLWDVSRGQFPLLALLVPERVDGIIATLLEHQRAQGFLPLWTAWGAETWCMIGNPSLPVIAHAVAAGFHGFDLARALVAMVASSTGSRPKAPAGTQRDWTDYETYGYLPYDREPGESVSKTLEYGWGDDAVARVAAALRHDQIRDRFAIRAQAYRKLFDARTQTMRGRSAAGGWREPFDPFAATSPLNHPGDYTEANAYQYTLTPALHDPDGLVELLGGPAAAGSWLDGFFGSTAAAGDKYLGQEGLLGQYAQGNEPSHHIAFLYAWTDRPWKSVLMIRKISSAFYSDRPDGIRGNDDAGQLSAWYVFATLGFYPMVPSSGAYVSAAPLVRAATLRLQNGRTLRILADELDDQHSWARAVRLRGEAVDPRALRYADIAAGGELRFDMAAPPR